MIDKDGTILENVTGFGKEFFNVFTFEDLMHDATDHCLVYEVITITRDLTTSSGLQLKKGTTYQAVWFLFVENYFHFIDWIPNPQNPNEYIPDPKTFVEIPQSELAPFLHWEESP